MSDFSQIIAISGVETAVLSDLEGTLLDSKNENDSEAIAAVTAFGINILNEMGSELGIGGNRQFLIKSSSKTSMTFLREEGVITISASSAKSAIVKNKISAIIDI
ncbi:hypothetical protein KKF91_01360 [Myxococcota bacterium]|nr:hypothetical protein [Myxococcota bacterium]MBU1429184.1 hypothetical protein [Myxococcota bacterium]MBU1896749.1 hypothetical protein [Myxococcota bacterium]